MMKLNLSEATGSVQAMLNDFIERLPYLAIALVVFIFFIFAGKAVRAAVPRLRSATATTII